MRTWIPAVKENLEAAGQHRKMFRVKSARKPEQFVLVRRREAIQNEWST